MPSGILCFETEIPAAPLTPSSASDDQSRPRLYIAVLLSSTKRASMQSCFGLRSTRSTIFAQVSSISLGAVTMTVFASTNGTAISPTRQLSFVCRNPPGHVRLKLAATSFASAYVSSNMRDSTPDAPWALVEIRANAAATAQAPALRQTTVTISPSIDFRV